MGSSRDTEGVMPRMGHGPASPRPSSGIRRAVALACLVVSASCTTQVDPRPLHDRDVALHLAWLIDEHTVHRIVADTLRPGDTLLRRLVAGGMRHRPSLEMIEASRAVDYLARSYPGESYEVVADSAGVPRRLRYRRSDGRLVIVENGGEGFTTRIESPVRTVAIRAASGRITSSLYQAFMDCGLSPELVLQFADVFAWTVDFLTECRPGDEFGVVFAESDIAPRVQLLGAAYRHATRKMVAVSVADSSGKWEFYAPDGASLQATFLRSPLNYRRVSSGFSRGRLHPVFKVRRPHLGVDYAAPAGTPVVAVADGGVSFAGRKGGFGICIELTHAGGCVTTYGHLQRIAAGVTRGSRIAQGEVIGYVGSTGIATGPHLDFRIRVQGRYVNPLTFDPPRAKALPPERMAQLRFRANLIESALAGADSGSVVHVDSPADLLGAGGSDTSAMPALLGFAPTRRDEIETEGARLADGEGGALGAMPLVSR